MPLNEDERKALAKAIVAELLTQFYASMGKGVVKFLGGALLIVVLGVTSWVYIRSGNG